MTIPGALVSAPASRCPACCSWPCGRSRTGGSPGGPRRFPRSVALLTAGCSVGQILGPPAVAPLLHHGYHRAVLSAALVVLAAAAAAAVLRIGFPHHMVVVRHTAPPQQRESSEHARPAKAGPDTLAPHSAN
ncbi:hypothetical protein [Streptomyces sp. NPDC001604]|uniref:hypothetical protein n=1 Tax=Streptomyces sp. NPDC001604 TaxID=3364593 RepID=UPI00368E0C7D